MVLCLLVVVLTHRQRPRQRIANIFLRAFESREGTLFELVHKSREGDCSMNQRGYTGAANEEKVDGESAGVDQVEEDLDAMDDLLAQAAQGLAAARLEEDEEETLENNAQQGKRKRGPSSIVWRHLKVAPGLAGGEVVNCNTCSSTFAKNSSTSTFKRHIETCSWLYRRETGCSRPGDPSLDDGQTMIVRDGQTGAIQGNKATSSYSSPRAIYPEPSMM
jgi:hypothetical protein